jgi:hypothetical protein
VQFAVTSVPRHQADAKKLLCWWRGLWLVENGLHYVRDVTFGEDDTRVRSGSAPQNLSAVCNAAISLLRALRVYPEIKIRLPKDFRVVAVSLGDRESPVSARKSRLDAEHPRNCMGYKGLQDQQLVYG